MATEDGTSGGFTRNKVRGEFVDDYILSEIIITKQWLCFQTLSSIFNLELIQDKTGEEIAEVSLWGTETVDMWRLFFFSRTDVLCCFCIIMLFIVVVCSAYAETVIFLLFLAFMRNFVLPQAYEKCHMNEIWLSFIWECWSSIFEKHVIYWLKVRISQYHHHILLFVFQLWMKYYSTKDTISAVIPVS